MRALGLLLIACITCLGADQIHLKSDEKIIFYTAIAQRISGTNEWRVEVRGSIFEPEKRRVLTAVLREALDLKGVKMSPAEEKILNERARLFLVDHERGKKMFVRFGLDSFAVGKSKADGNFFGAVVLRDADLERRAPPRLGVPFEAVLADGDARAYSGNVLLLEETGVSVISDIDDTIKITEVRDRHETLRNTFLREFQPVPGMADFYQRLARERGAQFHYVSASPWQLYEPLAEFIHAQNFPAGTFALKEFRWKNKTFFSLFADPEKYKPTIIEPLLKQFPKRRFILIGDSGERDPEIYGALARKFPGQIERIYIRDVTDEAADAERYVKAFRDVPPARWQIFREPGEIKVASE